MTFHAMPMFPGDLYDTTLRVAADAPTASASKHATDCAAQASATWQQFLSLGWQAVLVAEDHGGAGATLADVAAIAEAAGRHALPAPLVARCGVVPALLGRLTDSPAAAALRPAWAGGDASVCPVLDEDGAGVPRCRTDAEGVVVDGWLRGIDVTEPATHLVFAARTETGDDVLLLAARDALPALDTAWRGIDDRQTADLELTGVRLASAAVLARGEAARAAIAHALSVGALVSCAQIVGAIGAMVEQTIEYLNTRQQFGVALATFQALRHRTVDMYVAYENVRGMVRRRVLALDAGDADARQVSQVKLYLAHTARQNAESCIQLHGGIGMSRELPAARLAMHALSCSLLWGDRFAHLDRLAASTTAPVPVRH